MTHTVVKKEKTSRDVNEFLVDMHVHTNTSPCSYMALEDTLAEIEGAVDAIVITDHDAVNSYDESYLSELEKKYEVKVFTQSLEISTAQGHILAYGMTENLPINLDVHDVIEIIHSKDGLAVAAHPFTPMGIGDTLYNADVDAIEINCSRPKYANLHAREAAKTMGVTLISGSDSHTSFQVTVCATKYQKPLNSMKEIIEEVKKGNCSPVYLR